MAVRKNRCSQHRFLRGCFFCTETNTGGYIEVTCFGDRLRTQGGDISLKLVGPEGSQIGTLGSREACALAYAILAQQGVTL